MDLGGTVGAVEPLGVAAARKVTRQVRQSYLEVQVVQRNHSVTVEVQGAIDG